MSKEETPYDMNEVGKMKYDLRVQTLESEDEEKKEDTPPTYSIDEKWVLDYVEQFGEEPSFF